MAAVLAFVQDVIELVFLPGIKLLLPTGKYRIVSKSTGILCPNVSSSTEKDSYYERTNGLKRNVSNSTGILCPIVSASAENRLQM